MAKRMTSFYLVNHDAASMTVYVGPASDVSGAPHQIPAVQFVPTDVYNDGREEYLVGTLTFNDKMVQDWFSSKTVFPWARAANTLAEYIVKNVPGVFYGIPTDPNFRTKEWPEVDKALNSRLTKDAAILETYTQEVR